MLSRLRSIINNINKDPNRKIRVLTFPTHEGYQSTLGLVPNVEWHMYMFNGGKKWDYHTRNLPLNHYIYEQTAVRGDVQFDCVLSQEPLSQYPIARNLKESFGIPLISLFHTEVYPNMTPKRVAHIRQSQISDINIFITKHNQSSWGYDDTNSIVIPHGIDTNIFNGWSGGQKVGISCVNHFKQRDVFCGFSIWEEVAKSVQMALVGENPGVSQSINDPTKLAQIYGQYAFFLNTSVLSPCPLSLLEAAACGMPIISTANQEVPKIFTHGESALLSNDPKTLIKYCNEVMNNQELAQKLGNNARKLILDNFNVDQFTKNWRNVLE